MITQILGILFTYMFYFSVFLWIHLFLKHLIILFYFVLKLLFYATLKINSLKNLNNIFFSKFRILKFLKIGENLKLLNKIIFSLNIVFFFNKPIIKIFFYDELIKYWQFLKF